MINDGVEKDDGEIVAAGDDRGAALVVADQALGPSVMDHVAALAQHLITRLPVTIFTTYCAYYLGECISASAQYMLR